MQTFRDHCLLGIFPSCFGFFALLLFVVANILGIRRRAPFRLHFLFVFFFFFWFLLVLFCFTLLWRTLYSHERSFFINTYFFLSRVFYHFSLLDSLNVSYFFIIFCCCCCCRYILCCLNQRNLWVFG